MRLLYENKWADLMVALCCAFDESTGLNARPARCPALLSGEEPTVGLEPADALTLSIPCQVVGRLLCDKKSMIVVEMLVEDVRLHKCQHVNPYQLHPNLLTNLPSEYNSPSGVQVPD